MSLVASSLVAAESVPTGPEDLWDPGSLLRADWSRGMEISTSWPGSSGLAYSSSEKRVARSGKPLRTLRFTIRALFHDQREPWRLKNLLRRLGVCRQLVPLWPDATWTTAVASSGATTLACDTSYRRFFSGARVAIGGTGIGSTFPTYEIATIGSGITSTALPLTAGLVHSYPAGARVAPLLECDCIAEADAERVAGGKLQLKLIARECPGAGALPPTAASGGSSGFSTYNGYPIFDPGFNAQLEWLSSHEGWKRINNAAPLGLGSVFSFFGSRPREHQSRVARPTSRQQAWAIMQFFDTCQGPLRPFYAPAPLPMMLPVAIGSSMVTVPAAGPLEDYADYPLIAVVSKTAGPTAAQILPISGVTRAAGLDTIAVTGTLTASSLAQVWFAAPANLLRFEGEDLVERWTTSEFAAFDFSLVESLSETMVAFLGAGGLCAGSGLSTVPPLTCSAITNAAGHSTFAINSASGWSAVSSSFVGGAYSGGSNIASQTEGWAALDSFLAGTLGVTGYTCFSDIGYDGTSGGGPLGTYNFPGSSPLSYIATLLFAFYQKSGAWYYAYQIGGVPTQNSGGSVGTGSNGSGVDIPGPGSVIYVGTGGVPIGSVTINYADANIEVNFTVSFGL
jgi:hypothetical protein